MRSYPRNSPEAAARLIALVLIADGHVCRSEVEVIRHLQVERELGLDLGSFGHIMHTLCEDLLMGACGGGTLMCSVDAATLASLTAEIDDPELQRKVLRLAADAAAADRHLADAEARILAAARAQWRLEAVALPVLPAPRLLQAV